jgi:hypothetical protein
MKSQHLSWLDADRYFHPFTWFSHLVSQFLSSELLTLYLLESRNVQMTHHWLQRLARQWPLATDEKSLIKDTRYCPKCSDQAAVRPISTKFFVTPEKTSVDVNFVLIYKH